MANQLTLLEGEPRWTTAMLAVWRDAHIPHSDLAQLDARRFIQRAVEAVIARTGACLEYKGADCWSDDDSRAKRAKAALRAAVRVDAACS